MSKSDAEGNSQLPSLVVCKQTVGKNTHKLPPIKGQPIVDGGDVLHETMQMDIYRGGGHWPVHVGNL